SKISCCLRTLWSRCK
ncbi:methyl-accepting chemotaxis domain protein, partial [Vibrio harveyi]